jgi:uncharacterized membrane protein YjfL (UPF0719 family)
MADISDRVDKGLSEMRTAVLGAQILLGFQYEALFQPRFGDLPPPAQAIEAVSFVLLFATVVVMLAPAAFHRLSERGEATRAQTGFTSAMAATGLCLFALAIGLNVTMVTLTSLGPALAAGFGAAAIALSLFLWFGLEMILRRPAKEPPMTDEKLPLPKRVSQMLTESRIVLPGVQALLGFQFAAYLTDAFAKLPASAQASHTAGLALLLIAMILLMAPGPFHRLAERGEDTARADRFGVSMVMAALAPLGLGLACDCYVVLAMVSHDPALSAAVAAAAALVAFGLWFAWPLVSRATRRDPLRHGAAAE